MEHRSSSPAPAEEGQSGLVFVGGFPSGGTDLLKNVMNAHPQVHIAGEFPLLPTLARSFGPTVAADRAGEALAALRRVDSYGHLAGAVTDLPEPVDGAYTLAALYRHLMVDPNPRWVGNKTPENTQSITQLRTLFPAAKIIVIVRDVRDVALSWERKWGKDKTLCAAKWSDRMIAGHRLGAALPTRDYMLVRYEELLDGLESHTRRLCRFLGLEHAPEMLAFAEHVPEVVDGKLNYGRPLVASNQGKWRAALSARDLRRIEEVAYDGLRHFGYEINLATAGRPVRRREKLRGRVRDAYATLAIGNRASSADGPRARIDTARLELRKLLLRRIHRWPST